MIKALLEKIVGPVAVWRIFRYEACASASPSPSTPGISCHETSANEVSALQDPLLAGQSWYGGQGALAFAAFLNDEIAGLCFYWQAQRYTLSDFWPVKSGEAMLMQIVTSPVVRGRGVARSLIQYSTRATTRSGLRVLWARVWVTNAPSARAFRAAGWHEVAWVIELNPLRRSTPWRIRLPRPLR